MVRGVLTRAGNRRGLRARPKLELSREHRILSLLIRLLLNGPLQQETTMEGEHKENGFFGSHRDEHGTFYVASPDAGNVPTPCFDLKLLEVVQRGRGDQFA
jgi:hypothetical protein